MIEMQIEIDDKRVKEMLKKMNPAIQQALLRFLKKAGSIIKSSAKANAPVDTSRLRGSISSRPEGIRQVIIGPNVDYGIYQEFGTKYMKAQPYMRPALEDNIDNVRDIFIREINLAIQRT